MALDYHYWHAYRRGCGCNSCKELATTNQTNRTYDVPVAGLSAFEEWKLINNLPDASFDEFIGSIFVWRTNNWNI